MKIAACSLLLVLLAACDPPDLLKDDPTSGTSTSGHSKYVGTMPDVVGSNLQAAQDKIQDVVNDPVYLTTSHDATNQGREQVRDKDWKVCTQNVPAGQQIGMKSTIDFGVVKNGESCP